MSATFEQLERWLAEDENKFCAARLSYGGGRKHTGYISVDHTYHPDGTIVTRWRVRDEKRGQSGQYEGFGESALGRDALPRLELMPPGAHRYRPAAEVLA